MSPKPRNRASMDAEAVARLMAAQDQAEQDVAVEPVEPTPPAAPEPEPVASAEPTHPVQPAPVQTAPAQAAPPSAAFDPGKVDGRTLRRTGREPFATRIKPEAHEALRRIAYHRRITIAEALEMAVEAFDGG